MNRKHFLAAIASAATLLAPPVLQAATTGTKRRKHITIPPYLQPGDMIGITSKRRRPKIHSEERYMILCGRR